ncbi:MAG: PDZ domain-containing protein, partial [Bacteriovoracaceae bacterium]|nr:PDZ domain-containing protein [Bacteriovoracaceae bacterium]
MKKYILALAFISAGNIFAVTKSRFEELELFNKVLYLIESQYYREVDTNKLIEGALKGMMDTLDPHSAYLDKEFFTKMQNDTDGEFGGLGIEVTQKDGLLYVVTPIDDTPAYKAGIRPKDKIVEINHESIIGLTLDEA